MSKIKVYRASAGSGKTYILSLEYIKCLLATDIDDYFQYILAVSFTKDATNEMKERILAELYGLSMSTADSVEVRSSLKELWLEEGWLWDENLINAKSKRIFQAVLHNYSRLNITTIDSFFQRLVRNLARELGNSSHFNLEMNTQRVIQEVVSNVIDKANCNSQLLEWITIYIEHLINEGKNWKVEESLEAFGRCIYNEFFQEHKKDLLDTLRSFSKIVSYQNQIRNDCLTFFKNASQEVKLLLEEYQFNENDFIQKGFPIAYFRKLAKGYYSGESKIIEKCCIDKEAWVTKNHKKREDIMVLVENKLMPLLNLVCEKLQKARTERIIMDNLYQLGLVGEITKEIEQQNYEQNRFILSDTNIFLHQMIDDSDAPFIYEKIGIQIKHVMIDEFQDTSRLQWKNFCVLLKEILARNAFSLIVGDEKQSIYRWRNSDWRILNGVAKELGGDEKSLLYNWRSEKYIIDFNNAFFPLAAGMFDNEMFSAYEADKVGQKTKNNHAEGYVSVRFVADNEENGKKYSEQMQEEVLEQLKMLYDKNISVQDICLLVRKNETISILAEYLSQKRDEYPEMAEKHYLTIVSNEAFYLRNSLAVRIIITSLKIIVDADNKIHKEQLVYLLKTGGLVKDIQNILAGLLLSMPLFELVGYLCQQFELQSLLGQSAYLFTFYDYLMQYLNSYPSTVHHFLEHWEREGQTKTVPTGTGVEGIKAMTVHKSKGLQFSTLIIPYCDWKLAPEKNPLIWCKSKEDIQGLPLLPVTYKKEMKNTVFASEYEEETTQSYMDNLNLLYVAFTRAERNLIILTRYRKTPKDIRRVSDLLQWSVGKLDGCWNEEKRHFEMGKISLSKGKKDLIVDNPLKKAPVRQEVRFLSVDFQSGKTMFRQSNQSWQFTANENTYIDYANVMHHLFAQIDCWEDIEKAVDEGVIQGLIQPDERAIYVKKIQQSIQVSGVNDWFSSRYKTYREYSIITEENGTVVNKRPDRVLIAADKTVIIDYKFGEPHSSHNKQLQQYVDLLARMNYPNIEAYLWYVEKNQVKHLNL